MSNFIWDKIIITEFIRLSVPLEKVSLSLWQTVKSPKTNKFADGLIERTSSMLDELESNMYKDQEGGQ